MTSCELKNRIFCILVHVSTKFYEKSITILISIFVLVCELCFITKGPNKLVFSGEFEIWNFDIP